MPYGYRTNKSFVRRFCRLECRRSAGSRARIVDDHGAKRTARTVFDGSVGRGAVGRGTSIMSTIDSSPLFRFHLIDREKHDSQEKGAFLSGSEVPRLKNFETSVCDIFEKLGLFSRLGGLSNHTITANTRRGPTTNNRSLSYYRAVSDAATVIRAHLLINQQPASHRFSSRPPKMRLLTSYIISICDTVVSDYAVSCGLSTM